MSYTSKYTGNEIDELLDKVKESEANCTVIYEGGLPDPSQALNVLNLYEPVTNFDELGFFLTLTNSGQKRYLYRTIPVEVIVDLIENETSPNNGISFCWGYGSLSDYFDIILGTTVNSLTVKANLINTTKIVGIKSNKLQVSSEDSAPIGNIISFMGTKAPNGYLVCDGTELEISKYAKLAAHFEEQFGTKNHFGGDGTTTFAIPDLRNEFLRGYHNGGDEQLSGEVGMHQDATKHLNYYGSGSGKNVTLCTTGDYTQTLNKDSNEALSETFCYVSGTAQSHTSNLNTYFSSRPTNVAVLYCIKY